MSRSKILACVLVVFFRFICCGIAQGYNTEILPDGVEHYSVPSNNPNTPRFVELFEQIYDETIPTNSPLPFGKSAALLIGVSAYKNISPPLPSTFNDVVGLRDFMLTKAGFDDVFVMRDAVPSRDLVEKYMKAVLPNVVGEHGRLFFYFSGHGSDSRSKTGYMQFADAKQDEFWGQSVIPISVVTDWSHEMQIKHMVFVFDCCSSGLAFTSKRGNEDSIRLLYNTLSGNGSRTVLTAGTSDEKAFALASREGTGYGVFTSAFLSAFDDTKNLGSRRGMFTIHDVFAALQKEVAKFSTQYKQSANPRIWSLQDADYRGTFVFLDPLARKSKLDSEQAELLRIPLKTKGADLEKLGDGTGILQVTAYFSGKVRIGEKSMGSILAKQTAIYPRQRTGKIKVELIGLKSISQIVEVSEGVVTEVFFKSDADQIVESPLQSNTNSLRGAFLIDYGEFSGDVYIDGHKAGFLAENYTLLVENLPIGPHRYSIHSKDVVIQGEFIVEEGKTFQLAHPKKPAPPTNLRVIYQ